jgi:hypothetical protein
LNNGFSLAEEMGGRVTVSSWFTREVGRKFNADGSARRFAGNTIICFVDPHSPLGALASDFQDAVRATALGEKFALLLPSSFHMTVMELLCDEARVAERWSTSLPLDAPLEATDSFFQQIVPSIAVPERIVMRCTDLYTHGYLTLTLEAIDDVVAVGLRTYRERVAAATGVRFPDHDSYRFHMTLAYLIVELTPEEEQELAALRAEWLPRLCDVGAQIALPAPQLTFFADMTHFALEKSGVRSQESGVRSQE